MIFLTKKTKHHFIQWKIKTYNSVNFQQLPKVCQYALVTEFFASKGIFFGLQNIIPEYYWLQSDEQYGYDSRNYFYYESITGIERTIKIADLIYNKKFNNNSGLKQKK